MKQLDNNRSSIKKLLTIFCLTMLITACNTERNYRGVAQTHWKELSGEQKQLIVDQAYEKEFGDNE